jgi:hypothetical protein
MGGFTRALPCATWAVSQCLPGRPDSALAPLWAQIRLFCSSIHHLRAGAIMNSLLLSRGVLSPLPQLLTAHRVISVLDPPLSGKGVSRCHHATIAAERDELHTVVGSMEACRNMGDARHAGVAGNVSHGLTGRMAKRDVVASALKSSTSTTQ